MLLCCRPKCAALQCNCNWWSIWQRWQASAPCLLTQMCINSRERARECTGKAGGKRRERVNAALWQKLTATFMHKHAGHLLDNYYCCCFCCSYCSWVHKKWSIKYVCVCLIVCVCGCRRKQKSKGARLVRSSSKYSAVRATAATWSGWKVSSSVKVSTCLSVWQSDHKVWSF